MITILSEPSPDTLAIRMSGEVRKSDYETLVPVLENKIKKHGSLNLYVEMDGISRFRKGALWKDVKFDVVHANDFGKVAMVGETTWLEWMTRFSDAFTRSDIRYYDIEEKDKAWRWVSS